MKFGQFMPEELGAEQKKKNNSKEERYQERKEHFNDVLRNLADATDKHTKEKLMAKNIWNLDSLCRKNLAQNKKKK